MTTTTKSRPRVKPERRVQIGNPSNGVYAVHMTIGTGATAKHFGYYLQPIAADFGLGFQIEKFGTETTEGEDAGYQVNIDLEHGHHSCTCKGGTYCGHCKHQEAILALLRSGRLCVASTR